MRILIYKWKAYSYRDIAHTLQQMGHEIDWIEQPMLNYEVDPEFEAMLRERLAGNSYQFVFSVNYFTLLSNVCQSCKVKYVVWTYDNPLISMYHESVFHSCNYIFTFDKTNYLEFRQMGVEHIWYLPLAAEVERMDYMIADSQQKYEGDVTFVGNLYERNTYNQLQHRLPEYLKGYLDAVMEAQMNISGANIISPLLTSDILEQLDKYFNLEKEEGSFSDLGLVFETTVLGFKIAEIQRRRMLIELSKRFEVHLFSDSDASDYMRVINHGVADYWAELPGIFHNSKININYTIPNIKSGIPLRVWDVLASGGFLLTNFQAEIPYFFEEDVDLVCFDGPEDLCEKVAYYLAHEEERKQIARNGYEKVKKYHTYRHRLEEMLQMIEQSV